MSDTAKGSSDGASAAMESSAPEWNVTVHVSLPLPGHGFKDIDPADVDLNVLFSRLAADNRAEISAEEANEDVTITVKARSRRTAQSIIATLKHHLVYHSGEESVWRPELLVHPPTAGRTRFVALLRPKEGTDGRYVTAAQGLEPAEAGEREAAKAAYRAELASTLDRLARHLRNVPVGMSMKVHFGTVLLTAWTKDQDEYPFSELAQLASWAGKKGTASMDNTVGEVAVRNLIDRLSDKNKKLPGTVRDFLKAGDPERTFSLVLDTKNLRAESTFEKIQGQREHAGDAKRAQQYILGAVATHHQETVQKAAQVVTVCPESGHDWAIKISRKEPEQDTPAPAPFNTRELQQSIAFTGEVLADGFPVMTVANHFLRSNDVQTVRGKTTLKYLLGSRYTLEIGLSQEWDMKQPGRKASARPGVAAEVTLYSPEWDDWDMRQGAPTPREWDASFARQFLEQGGDEAPGAAPGATTDPVEFLLLWVDWVLKALDGDPEADT